jgi:hypothetical protein
MNISSVISTVGNQLKQTPGKLVLNPIQGCMDDSQKHNEGTSRKVDFVIRYFGRVPLPPNTHTKKLSGLTGHVINGEKYRVQLHSPSNQIETKALAQGDPSVTRLILINSRCCCISCGDINWRFLSGGGDRWSTAQAPGGETRGRRSAQPRRNRLHAGDWRQPTLDSCVGSVAIQKSSDVSIARKHLFAK